MSTQTPSTDSADKIFISCLVILGGFYVVMILALLFADVMFVVNKGLGGVLGSEYIRYSVKLSLISCSITTILSIWVAVPIGYIMSRFEFKGKAFIDAVLDIPIVLPPLVIGISLLIFFQTSFGKSIEGVLHVTYAIPSVILAQFMVACAFAVRTMRSTFDQIDPRREQVALTLGCSRNQAFWSVVFPDCQRGLLAAATLAWARSLGEFGPILIFAGTTRMKTEVLSSSVFLELMGGNIEGAVAISLLMIAIASIVLILVRVFASSTLYLGYDPARKS